MAKAQRTQTGMGRSRAIIMDSAHPSVRSTERSPELSRHHDEPSPPSPPPICLRRPRGQRHRTTKVKRPSLHSTPPTGAGRIAPSKASVCNDHWLPGQGDWARSSRGSMVGPTKDKGRRKVEPTSQLNMFPRRRRPGGLNFPECSCVRHTEVRPPVVSVPRGGRSTFNGGV